MKANATIMAAACISMALAGCGMLHESQPGGKLRVVSDTTVTGFAFPESVGCDARDKVLYVSNFGGTEPKSADKDSKGYISKVALDGKVIEERWLPASGEILHKPKGIWIEGNRLWVTDIDAVWVYDIRTRKGRKLELAGIKFANDPAVRRGVLYVSDNRSDQLFRVEPADFLDAGVQPRISVVVSGKVINPNGIYPTRGGGLLMVGSIAPDQPRGIWSMGADGDVKALSQPIGRLDGIYEMRDGSLLATDWNSGSVFRWTPAGGMEPLATGFKGPADLCVMGEDGSGLTAYVPDLTGNNLRIIRLAR